MNKFGDLAIDARKEIASRLVRDISEDLKIAVRDVLDTDIDNLPARISGVEMLLKTNRDELILRSFGSIADSLQYMSGLVRDRSDISGVLLDKSLED